VTSSVTTSSLAHLVAATATKVTVMTDTEVKSRAPGWVPDLSTLGARLALVRQAMGWNIAEAATACGVPVASWRNWENRGKEPRGLINVAMKIAGVTGIDYRWLALGPDQRLPEGAGSATPYYVHSQDQSGTYSTTERVVAIGLTDRRVDSANGISGVRARPLDLGRSAVRAT
jgi:transcriptional regulator with XRE-family HTH domain